MKYEINIKEGVVSLPGILRVFVIILLPWLAIWVARKQLWLACLVISNTARSRFPEDKTMLRWANELERNGKMIP